MYVAPQHMATHRMKSKLMIKKECTNWATNHARCSCMVCMDLPADCDYFCDYQSVVVLVVIITCLFCTTLYYISLLYLAGCRTACD